MTQNERVLQYMQDFGSISTLDAFVDLGVTRLASRVCDIRSQGVTITSEFETAKNRYGDNVRYKRYRLGE